MPLTRMVPPIAAQRCRNDCKEAATDTTTAATLKTEETETDRKRHLSVPKGQQEKAVTHRACSNSDSMTEGAPAVPGRQNGERRLLRDGRRGETRKEPELNATKIPRFQSPTR